MTSPVPVQRPVNQNIQNMDITNETRSPTPSSMPRNGNRQHPQPLRGPHPHIPPGGGGGPIGRIPLPPKPPNPPGPPPGPPGPLPPGPIILIISLRDRSLPAKALLSGQLLPVFLPVCSFTSIIRKCEENMAESSSFTEIFINFSVLPF